MDKLFRFVCSVPEPWINTWSGSWPDIESDISEIAKHPLRNNIERELTMPIMQDTGLAAEGSPSIRIETNPEDNAPWEFGKKVKDEIIKEAIKCRGVNSIKSLERAKTGLLVAGQNCHFLANAGRDSCGDLLPDHFRDELFKEMKKSGKSLGILILDPARTDEVEFWHQRLIKSSCQRQQQDRIPPKVSEPDFKADLTEAISIFKDWQKKPKKEITLLK